MSLCMVNPCQRTAAGCRICDGPASFPPPYSPPPYLAPTPSPRFMPVNIPFSNIGITIVTLDGYGNVSIKVDQPYPDAVGGPKL